MRFSRIVLLAGFLALVLAAADWIGCSLWPAGSPGALESAVQSGKVAEAQRLLAAGANPNVRVTPYSRTVAGRVFQRPSLLVVAMAGKPLPMTKALLRLGASPLVRQSSNPASLTLAEVAYALPPPWRDLLNDPRYAVPPPTVDIPEVILRALAQQQMAPMYLPTFLLAGIGLHRIGKGARDRLLSRERWYKLFLQGLGFLFLAFLALFLYPIIN